MNHAGTFLIQTPRLILRKFREDDAADMAVWAGDPSVQNEYGEPVYDSPDAVRGLLRRYISGCSAPDFYRWAIEECSSGRNIGMIAFCRVYDDIRTAEIEYCIAAPYWGNGYAGEAMNAVIRGTFSRTDFQKLEAYARSENQKSVRVLEKSLMHRTETVERFRRTGESAEGEECFCIFSSEVS